MKDGKYINPKRAGFIGRDGERDNADNMMGCSKPYKKGGSVSKEKMSMKKGCDAPIKRAMGGVAKIRLGQATPSGRPKDIKRATVSGNTYK